MTDRSTRRQWIKTTHRPGGTFVTVTLVEGGFTAKHTVKCYFTTMAAGVREAYAGAEKGLIQARAAMAEIELERKRAA